MSSSLQRNARRFFLNRHRRPFHPWEEKEKLNWGLVALSPQENTIGEKM